MHRHARPIVAATATSLVALASLAPARAEACTPLTGSAQAVHLVRASSPYCVAAAQTVNLTGGLVVDAGVRVDMGKDSWIHTKGAVQVNGSITDRVVLQADPAVAGTTWGGLVVETGAAAVSLASLTISGVGDGANHTLGPKNAALVLYGANPVKAVGVRVQDYLGYAVAVAAPFDAGSDEIWAPEPTFISHANAVAYLSEPKYLSTFPGLAKVPAAASATAIRTAGGQVHDSATWRSQLYPIVFDGDLTITTATAPSTVLTIVKNQLRFAGGVKVKVAGNAGGGPGGTGATADLVARDVSFGALDPNQAWGGILWSGQFTATSEITGGVVGQAPTLLSIDMWGSKGSAGASVPLTAVAPNVHGTTLGIPGLAPSVCIYEHADQGHTCRSYAASSITFAGCAPSVKLACASAATP